MKGSASSCPQTIPVDIGELETKLTESDLSRRDSVQSQSQLDEAVSFFRSGGQSEIEPLHSERANAVLEKIAKRNARREAQKRNLVNSANGKVETDFTDHLRLQLLQRDQSMPLPEPVLTDKDGHLRVFKKPRMRRGDATRRSQRKRRVAMFSQTAVDVPSLEVLLEGKVSAWSANTW